MFRRTMLAGLLACASTMSGSQHTTTTISVIDFGARGDGQHDDSRAFQQALDAVASGKKSNRVLVPRGDYVISSNLLLPENVTLEGEWALPPAWRDGAGSTLLVTHGAGEPEGTPFIRMSANSGLKGIAIFYPEQTETNPPVAYPWTIATVGAENCSLIDVLLVNPYQAVDFGSAPSGRHYIRGLYGQPLRRGIYVDKCLDVGRIENVHFWPFWRGGIMGDDEHPIRVYMATQGEAFIFARTDWQYVTNTFCWGYKYGYRFIKTADGFANGTFTGIGADAVNVGLQVDECAPYGLLITNGEFASIYQPNPTGIVVGPENLGTIQLQNCAFWGENHQVASIRGTGNVMFSNCNFLTWDARWKGAPAVEAFSGSVMVNASTFGRPGFQVRLHENVDSAVFSGNRVTGPLQIENRSHGSVQVGLNAETRVPREEPEAVVIDNTSTSSAFQAEGQWHLGMGGADYLVTTHWAMKGNGSAVARWVPDLPREGKYHVYLWYGDDPGNDHATDAPLEIRHADGISTLTINLKENTGRWNKLGTWRFAAGRAGSVSTNNAANGNVTADALKFVPAAP